jgi:hypothetical protein
MPSTNVITYTVPSGTTITRDNSSNQGSSDVTIGGTFSVSYTYSEAGALTAAAVSAVNLTTAGSGSKYDNLFNDFSSISSDNEGASVTILESGGRNSAPNGEFDFELRSLNETTTGTGNSATDFNTLRFRFDDNSALTVSKTDDMGPRTLDFLALNETYTSSSTSTSVSDSESSGSRDTLSAACYCKGTLIETEFGMVAIEDLQLNDNVVTVDGQKPVVWIGHSTIDCERQVHQDKAYPIQIMKDAFGAGMPQRDLYVSPDHSIYIENVMIPAYCLLNGITIKQDQSEKLVTYYHVELPSHSAIYAEGLPAESYLETSEANRHFFIDSSAQSSVTKIDAQYPPCPSDTPAWKHIWNTQGFAKLTQDGPVLDKVNKMLLDRAESLMSKQALAA